MAKHSTEPKVAIDEVKLWDDLRESLSEYSPFEALYYYRTAKWIASTALIDKYSAEQAEVIRAICDSVESVINAMQNSGSKTDALGAKILIIEHVDSMWQTGTEKYEQLGIGRTSYNKYWNTADGTFSSLYTKYVEGKLISMPFAVTANAASAAGGEA